jgi:hypothetical protein
VRCEEGRSQVSHKSQHGAMPLKKNYCDNRDAQKPDKIAGGIKHRLTPFAARKILALSSGSIPKVHGYWELFCLFGGYGRPFLRRRFRQKGAGMGGHKKTVDILPGYTNVKGYFHFVQKGEKKERVDILILLPNCVLWLFEPQIFTFLIGMNEGKKKKVARTGLLDFLMYFFEA